jgi:RNA polymerase primary sigma factor
MERSLMNSYLRDIERYPMITVARERELSIRIRRKDATAVEELYLSNLRLVIKIARDYAWSGIDLMDLIQLGNDGLMQAAKRYDHRKGAKFSVFAAYWIKQRILNSIRNTTRIVRVPAHRHETHQKIYKEGQKFWNRHGREPSDAELAQSVGVSVKKLRDVEGDFMSPVYLDAPTYDDSSGENYERLPALMSVEDAVGHAIGREDLSSLQYALSRLDDRSRRIITQRFGLGDEKCHTLEEVGKQYGLTRERIRQLQNLALERITFHVRQYNHGRKVASPRPPQTA